MFKKLFKEISRPFEYASKTGSSQTSEAGRANTGGQVTGASTTLIHKSVQIISPLTLKNHLIGKGISADVAEHFVALQYVTSGSREKKELKFNQTSVSMDILGVAVFNNGSSLKVAVIWKRSSVSFNKPSVKVDFVTRHYGLGTRNSDYFSQYVDRGLTANETNVVMNHLTQESNKHQLAIEASQSL